MKNIIFIAPPASGKGTQSDLLKEKYNMVHISTGDLLRNEAASASPMGIYVKGLMDQGLLVDDEIILKLLEKRLQQQDCDNGYILDGFPRNLEQAAAYDEISKRLKRSIDYVILLDIKKDTAMRRITGRTSCPSCGMIYNEYVDTFTKQGFCNKCSSRLEKRSDDNEETFNKRFDTYLVKTQPVIDYYKEKGLLYVVDSNISKEYTFSQIEAILREE
ncbi:MAG: adenylate kinase [Bacilli bacterium]